MKSSYDIGLAAGLAGTPPEECPYTEPDAGKDWHRGRDDGADLREGIAADHARVLPHQVPAEAPSAGAGDLPSNYVAPPWREMPRRGRPQ